VRFEIQPVLSSTLPDVAGFLRRWRDNRAEGSSGQHSAYEDSLGIERRLRWLLVENPVVKGGSPHGYCIRDRLGDIRGLTLSFPAAFLAADQRLLGLCSGSFFVEPQARTLGYHLFKKYLSSPGYSFFFATTCNASSAALWGKLGGCAVPTSETEHILPLRLDVMLPAFVAARTSSKVASEIARIFGRCANPILQLLARQSSELAIEPCRDWQKLSELFRRHRSADWITTDRSAEFLQWRYGQTSPNYPCDIYWFRDKRGNEGWFCLGNVIRGHQGQIRGSVLLDAVWPREKMSFRDILPEILRLVGSEADAVFLRPQPGLDYGECSRWIIPHRSEAPRVFVITRKGNPLLPMASLDYDESDYGAWAVHWSGSRGRSASPQLFRSGVKPVLNSEL
jgi:hypothetical protein